MRRIVLWMLSTVTVLVLLFSYHTSTSSVVAPADQVAVAGAGNSGSKPAAASPTPARTTAPSSSAATGATTVAGSVVSTRYGPVQVQLTVVSGRITAATVLQVPNQDRRDQVINARAVPILNAAVVSAQSARIDTVSGATVTSDGYRTSLQAAIDRAHL